MHENESSHPASLGADLVFFLTALLVLLVAYVAMEQMPLTDQDRDTVSALHAKLTIAALAIMGAKILLRLMHLRPTGDEEASE